VISRSGTLSQCQPITHGDIFIDKNGLRHRCRVGQAGGFYHHPVKRQLASFLFGRQLAQNPHQVATHGAADAAVVHLDDLHALVLHQQFVINADFVKLVFNHRDALAVLLFQDVVEQRGFATAQDPGEDGDGGAGGAHG